LIFEYFTVYIYHNIRFICLSKKSSATTASGDRNTGTAKSSKSKKAKAKEEEERRLEEGIKFEIAQSNKY
jgi:hypothetical protein